MWRRSHSTLNVSVWFWVLINLANKENRSPDSNLITKIKCYWLITTWFKNFQGSSNFWHWKQYFFISFESVKAFCHNMQLKEEYKVFPGKLKSLWKGQNLFDLMQNWSFVWHNYLSKERYLFFPNMSSNNNKDLFILLSKWRHFQVC